MKWNGIESNGVRWGRVDGWMDGWSRVGLGGVECGA